MKKYCRVILIIQILLCCVMLPLGFREEELICSVVGNSILDQGSSLGNGWEYVVGVSDLNPGVYQVKISCDTTVSGDFYAEVTTEAAYAERLYGNGVSGYSETEYLDFEVYVIGQIPSAGVILQTYEADASMVSVLEIYKTNLGMWMLLCVVIAGFVMLDVVLWWMYKLRCGEKTWQELIYILGLMAGCVLVALPYLKEYYFGGWDSKFHMLRIEGLKESLLNGEALPIRVQAYWLFEHGYAVSTFYSDLFLVIPALLRLAGFPLVWVYKCYVFGTIVATAYVCYYALNCCVNDRLAAFGGAIIYLFVPYRIYDLYSRGAMGECSAMVFLPLVCAAMYLLYTRNPSDADYKRYKWYLVIGMSGCLQSHLLTTEMSVVLIAFTCVVLWRKTIRRSTFCQLVYAMGITLLLNAWFWIPMLYMLGKDSYQVNSVLTGDEDPMTTLPLRALLNLWPEHVGTGWGENGEPVNVGIAVLMLMVIYGIVCIAGKRKPNIEAVVFAAACIAASLLGTSLIPWEKLQQLPIIGSFVASLQFTGRWIMFAALFSGFLSGFTLRHLRIQNMTWFRCSFVLTLGIAFLCTFHYVADIIHQEESVYIYTAENMGASYVVSGEYLLGGTEPDEYYQHLPVAEEGLTYTDYEKEGLQIQMTLSNPTDQDLSLELPLTGYKGYAVECVDGIEDGRAEVQIAEDRGSHGDLRLIVPAGYEGTVHIWYRGFAIFRVAEWISLITIVGIIVYRVLKWRKNHRRKESTVLQVSFR